jgi:copper chaperone CopZ
MKVLYTTIVLFFLLVLPARSAFLTAELQVSGLTCAMCSYATERALRTIDFIEDIEVDLENTSYLISFKENESVDIDEIRKKVENAGFFVNRLVATFLFDELEVSADYHFVFNKQVYHFMDIDESVLKGPTEVVFLDRGFIPNRAFRQIRRETEFACYVEGYTQSCCLVNVDEKSRVFHITLK